MTLPLVRRTYPGHSDVPQCHFRSVEVEEIHELDDFAFFQGIEIHPFRLVIQLDLDREDLDVF